MRGVETIIAVPIPVLEIIWGPLIIANIAKAKNIKIGTIKYLEDWGSDPEIIEGLIAVIEFMYDLIKMNYFNFFSIQYFAFIW